MRPGCAADHSHPFLCRGHGRVELYLYPHSGPHRGSKWITLPLPFIYWLMFTFERSLNQRLCDGWFRSLSRGTCEENERNKKIWGNFSKLALHLFSLESCFYYQMFHKYNESVYIIYTTNFLHVSSSDFFIRRVSYYKLQWLQCVCFAEMN